MEGTLKSIGNVLYGGIRPEIPGHGGDECANYLTPKQMIGETLLSSTIMVVAGTLAWRTLTMPKTFPRHEDLLSKRALLAAMCLLFGIEIGYKICNRSALYLLNPCHIITAIEIWLLASKPGKISFSILRILIHYIYGAMVAMLFPDTLARQFPGETIMYWVQHVAIFFVIPPYLIWLWGPSTLEPFKEWSWACFAGILFGVQHHYIMQPIALLTHVNLNYLLCPALMDPFAGPYYRLWAVFHQTASLLILGKIYTLLLRLFLAVVSPILPARQLQLEPTSPNNKHD
jgi:hypothetical protein